MENLCNASDLQITLRRPLLAFAHFLEVAMTQDSGVAGGEVHC